MLTMCGRSSLTLFTPNNRNVVSISWPNTMVVHGQVVPHTFIEVGDAYFLLPLTHRQCHRH